MRIYLKMLAFLTIAVFSAISCKKDQKVFCAEVGLPMAVNISYVDENGNDLFFGTDPRFLLEDLSMYVKWNEQKEKVHFTIDKESKIIVVLLSQSANGTFFIELGSDEVDKVTYSASKYINDPCHNYMVNVLSQNDEKAEYNQHTQTWKLIK